VTEEETKARLEDLAFMIEHGETAEGCGRAARDLSTEGLRKWLDAQQRLDLFQALRNNEIRRFGATLAELRKHEAVQRRRGKTKVRAA
jgi:hypothetical protein